MPSKANFLLSFFMLSWICFASTAHAQSEPCGERQLAVLWGDHPRTFPYSSEQLRKVLTGVVENWVVASVCRNGPGFFTTFEGGRTNLIYVVCDRDDVLFIAPVVEGRIERYIGVRNRPCDYEMRLQVASFEAGFLDLAPP